ncbi:MAG: hypothetical protein GY796_36380 [Chloroflexi bacterium]|nr:hypothetical protein [Chloroflexota bacterium]
MDITVSQLNHRLALQLPSELPLGLLFVAGQVQQLIVEEREGVDGRSRRIAFDLIQGNYRLHCTVSKHESGRIELHDGDIVRVGGHLTFDTVRAEYSLLTRDVERVGAWDAGDQTTPGANREVLAEQTELASALTNVKRRTGVSASPSGEMPIWVQKLAPQEIQESLALDVEDGDKSEPADSARSKESVELDAALMAFLSEAMDDEEDMELTPDLLAQWHPDSQPEPALDGVEKEVDSALDDTAVSPQSSQEPAAAVQPYAPVAEAASSVEPIPETSSYTPPPAQHTTDWMVTLIIIAFFIFAIAIVILVILLAIR